MFASNEVVKNEVCHGVAPFVSLGATLGATRAE